MLAGPVSATSQSLRMGRSIWLSRTQQGPRCWLYRRIHRLSRAPPKRIQVVVGHGVRSRSDVDAPALSTRVFLDQRR